PRGLPPPRRERRVSFRAAGSGRRPCIPPDQEELMRTSRPRSWITDAAMGAAGGLLASWIMEKVMARAADIGSERTRRRERLAQEVDGQPATHKAADLLVRPIGVELSDQGRARLGRTIHFVYGSAWGAVLGALAPRVKLPPLAWGAAFGAGLWLLSDEVLVPLFRLSRPPWRYPASFHGKMLAAHLVYGAAADGTWRLLRRAGDRRWRGDARASC